MVRLYEIQEEAPYPELVDELKETIRTLLVARGNSTLSELKEDYANQIGDGWLPESFAEIEEILRSMPDIVCRKNHYGLQMWTVMKSRAKRPRSSNSNPTEVKRRKWYKEGFYYNFQLFGDDYFCDLVSRCLHTQSHEKNGRKVAGLCETGMSLRDAEKKVLQCGGLGQEVIVHVGAYDIIARRDFYKIKQDLDSLVRAFRSCQINPIICTIVPIANMAFDNQIRATWERVNNYIRAQDHWNILDLSSDFLTEDGKIDFYNYSPYATQIIGSSRHSISLWSRKGRDVALNAFKYLRESLLHGFDWDY